MVEEMEKASRTATYLVVMLLLISLFTIEPFDISNATDSGFPTVLPFLYIDPEKIVANVGDEITFSIKIFNLTNNWIPDPQYPTVQRPIGNLYGFDLKVKWDPQILECINRTVTVPVETYPNGVLHEPVLKVRDVLNNAEGTCRIAYSSQGGPPFNNPGRSNNIVILKFRVKTEGSTLVELVPVDPGSTPQQPAKLADNQANRIVYSYRGALFEVAGSPKPSFTVWPTDGYIVVNKTAVFNASESRPGPYGRSVVGFKWDFGDGNVTDWLSSPIAYYKYKKVGVYYAKLQVKDDSGRTSSWTEAKKITVVNKRDVALLFITFLTPRLVWGDILMFNVTVRNDGEAKENITVTTYYNSTDKGGWKYIGGKNVTVEPGQSMSVVFHWNTSLLPRENAYYKILANTTTVPHEHSTTNNEKISDPLELLTEPFHDIKILSVKRVAYVAGQEFELPAILGETVKVFFTVKAVGTYDELFDATLQVFLSNGTLWKTQKWANETIMRFRTKTFEFNFTSNLVDDLNVTIKVTPAYDKYPEDNFASYRMKIVAPPVLLITYRPETIYANEEVTLDATGSNHPSGIISTYTWERKRAGEGVERYRDRKTGVTATYKFETPGNWTVRLRVADNWGITYDASRPTTAAYQREILIQVLTPPSPPYHLYALAAVIVIVIIIVAVTLLRRKAKK
ncbi:MAG: PKD domain-containing protein [Nitrososphaerota archaeon]|nr:PKD domain-containing protein [Nitrososphaerota archaeon]